MALCPHCRHSEGLHSAPAPTGRTDDGKPLAPDYRAGRCGQSKRVKGRWIACDCPGWHPLLEPQKKLFE